MNFKDYVADDITKTFINIEELGEVKLIDGVEVKVMIDQDLIHQRPRLVSSGEDVYASGVYRQTITFFVSVKDLGYTPVQGQIMEIDGNRYIVTSVSESMGLFEITIEANQA